MQICRPEDAPVLRTGRSFAPSRGLLARVTWGRGEWFVRCSSELVAIHLGTPRGPRGAAPVLVLEPSEIAVVRREAEILALPDEHGSFVRGAMVYVDMYLRHSGTRDLQATLSEVAPADPARETVRVPQPGLIRLVWEGPYHRMRPDAAEAIELIRTAAGVAPEAQPRPKRWQELSEEDLGDHILQLQEAGRYAEATEILEKRDARDREGPTEYVHPPTANA